MQNKEPSTNIRANKKWNNKNNSQSAHRAKKLSYSCYSISYSQPILGQRPAQKLRSMISRHIRLL